jgi:hypothetical protein
MGGRSCLAVLTLPRGEDAVDGVDGDDPRARSVAWELDKSVPVKPEGLRPSFRRSG